MFDEKWFICRIAIFVCLRKQKSRLGNGVNNVNVVVNISQQNKHNNTLFGAKKSLCSYNIQLLGCTVGLAFSNVYKTMICRLNRILFRQLKMFEMCSQ